MVSRRSGMAVPLMAELPISVLLKRRCPPAVARFIVPVAVNAIQRFTCRPFTHIREEGGEVIAPTVANSDSSRAIECVFVMGRLIAALFGRQPTVIGGGSISP